MARKAAAKSTRPSRSPGFRDVGVGSRDFPAAMTELLEQQHLRTIVAGRSPSPVALRR